MMWDPKIGMRNVRWIVEENSWSTKDKVGKGQIRKKESRRYPFLIKYIVFFLFLEYMNCTLMFLFLNLTWTHFKTLKPAILVRIIKTLKSVLGF